MKIDKVKFIIGIFFLVLSVVGCFPLLNTVVSGRVESSHSTGEWMNSANKPVTEYRKNLIDTNYPIMLGCFALVGSLLIISIKEK